MRSIHAKSPEYLHSKLTFINDIHNYQACNTGNFYINRSNKTNTKKLYFSMVNVVIKVYNKLPEIWRSSPLKKVERKLRKSSCWVKSNTNGNISWKKQLHNSVTFLILTLQFKFNTLLVKDLKLPYSNPL